MVASHRRIPTQILGGHLVKIMLPIFRRFLGVCVPKNQTPTTQLDEEQAIAVREMDTTAYLALQND